MAEERQKGQQYRDLYVNEDPMLDSEFFRIRLSALLSGPDEDFALQRLHLSDLFTRSVGVTGITLHNMIMTAPRDRLLSFLTVLYASLRAQAENSASTFSRNAYFDRKAEVAPRKLLAAVATLFREERMAYEVDDEGGIHPLIDAEFQRNRQATLKWLSLPRYANVQHHVDVAFRRLTVENFDGKAAIRDIFDAAESLFKLIVAPKNPNLTAETVESELRPIINRVLADAPDATKQAAGRALSSFGKWADACHPYRHGQQAVAIVAPPRELSTLLISPKARVSFDGWRDLVRVQSS